MCVVCYASPGDRFVPTCCYLYSPVGGAVSLMSENVSATVKPNGPAVVPLHLYPPPPTFTHHPHNNTLVYFGLEVTYFYFLRWTEQKVYYLLSAS